MRTLARPAFAVGPVPHRHPRRPRRLPVIPTVPFIAGHEGVGIVTENGAAATNFQARQRVAMPWLGYACAAADPSQERRQSVNCCHPTTTGLTVMAGLLPSVQPGIAVRLDTVTSLILVACRRFVTTRASRRVSS